MSFEIITPPSKDVIIRRRMAKNKLILNEQSMLQRDPIIEDGVEIQVEAGGEFFIL